MASFPSPFDEPEMVRRLRDRRAEIKRQLKKFTPTLLKKILYSMAELDVAYKKGQININFALDLLILKKLE